MIVNTLSELRPFGPEGRLWQYHPRSDRHSKIGAVAVVLDLLAESPELCADVERGEAGFRVNPVLTVPQSNRKKALDLAIARPDDFRPVRGARTLGRLAEDYDMVLTKKQRRLLDELPQIRECNGKEILVALENKACMTAFSKAAPRLRNELDGSRETINQCDPDIIAGGLVFVNAAERFVSPTFRDNGWLDDPRRRAATHHVQPEDVHRAVDKLHGIQRRSGVDELGFDALGILVVNAVNDGSPWSYVEDEKYGAPQPGDNAHYVSMVQRLAMLYRKRFRR